MDGITSNVEVFIDENALGHKLDGLLDNETMTAIHNLLAKMCDPYVPFEQGVLATNIEVTKDYVRYNSPYAHYQYTGDVYGPNIPIMENGIIVGWFSPPGQTKKPTGEKITYGTNVHPQATDHWDQAMMRDHADEFTEQVKQILIRRARQLYG